MGFARPSLLALAATLAGLAGCGGDEASDRRATPERGPEPPSQRPPAPAPPGGGRDPSALPPGVPSSGRGPAPAGSEPVIRAWLAAVRRADFDRAAATFARGARVQNGGPVLRLESRADAVLWNATLPCGATLAEARGARGYAVVTFRLTKRRGADCGSGTGAPAYGAIRVRDGRITEWYRLPDPARPPREDPPAEPFVEA